MKIVYFDYWTKGSYNFEAIDSILKLKNHDTILLHVNSFRNYGEEYCEVNNIKTLEIKELNTIFIYNALKKLKPDVIVTLNTPGILDRALVLSARKFNSITGNRSPLSLADKTRQRLLVVVYASFFFSIQVLYR